MKHDAGLLKYVETIEKRFAQARGRDVALSPRDFTLACRWYRAGVPVAWILRCFDEPAADEGGVKSLSFYARRIEKMLRARL